ncbi:MAG: hypothetical protein JXB38_05350, partial [Anaerolineales bacterium]|nr:hypothetical protein [Anaerolineales bacterium]
YSFTPEEDDPGFDADVTAAEYAEAGMAKAKHFALENPGYVAGFVLSHTLHNEVSTLLALPAQFTLADNLVTFYNLRPYWESDEGLWQDCCSLHTYVDDLPYWHDWTGDFPPQAWLPLLFSLAMIALGIGAAWKRVGLIGLLPLVVHLAYSASTAIARVSGWRLILPVDWVGIFYFSLGLSQLTLAVLAIWAGGKAIGRLRFGAESDEAVASQAKFPWRAVLVTSLLVLLIGVSVPLVEVIVPPRYINYGKAQALTVLTGANHRVQAGFDNGAFLEDDNAVALWGRALYPRYYPAGEGEPSDSWSAFTPYPYSRVGFYLAGPQNAQVVLPLDTAPDAFPHAADVLVLGCSDGGLVEAFAVMFYDSELPGLYVPDLPQFPCQVERE